MWQNNEREQAYWEVDKDMEDVDYEEDESDPNYESHVGGKS